jgi:hypothetical protein
MTVTPECLRGLGRWCVIVFLACFSASALAHKLGQSYVFMRIADGAIDGRIEMTVADANRLLGLGLPERGATRDDVTPHLATIAEYLKSHVAFAPNGNQQAVDFHEYGIDAVPLADYIAMHFALSDQGRPISKVDVEYRIGFALIPEHRGLLVIEHDWGSGTFNDESNVVAVFGPDSIRQQIDLSKSSVWTGVKAMIGLGAHHIWIGIDHILFLIALLLPAVVERRDGVWQPVREFKTALWRVLAVVTVFTAAHTITLSLAALDIAALPSRIVESVIALSIAAAAMDVLRPFFGRRILLVVFGFGLFHGFGFASVLRDMGIPSQYLVHSLIGFNVGVELGQIAIVSLVFPVLYVMRGSAFYLRYVLRFGAITLIGVAAYWFTERVLEIDLPLGAILQWPFRAWS